MDKSQQKLNSKMALRLVQKVIGIQMDKWLRNLIIKTASLMV